MSIPARSRMILGVLLSLVAMSLTACSARIVGQTGIGVDSQGRAVGYLVVCRKKVDNLVLYYNDSSGEHIVGKWHSATPVTKESVLTLQDPPAAWEEETAPGSLVNGIEYHLSGGSDDNKTSTVGVSFTLDAVAKLSPGQILFQRGDSARRATSIGGMRSQVCQ